MKKLFALVSTAVAVGASLLVTMPSAGANEHADNSRGKQLTVSEAQQLLSAKSGRTTVGDINKFFIMTTVGKCVGTAGSPTNGADVVQNDCDFTNGQTFVATGPGPYITPLRIHGTTNCLDVRDRASHDGAQLQVRTCDEYTQRFQFIQSNDGETVSILPADLMNQGRDMCLDLPDATPDNGAQLQIWNCSYINDQFDLTPAQRFTLMA